MPSTRPLTRTLRIVRLADRLLKQSEIEHPPVSTDLLHRCHPDLKVLPAALGQADSLLKIDQDASGRVHRAAIYFNDRRPIPRQRFSIAHEYGHFLLHHHLLADADDETPPSDRRVEEEADLFASSLLVPLWLLDTHCPEVDYSPKNRTELDRISLKLASLFNVSRACMRRAIFQLYHLRKVYAIAPGPGSDPRPT